MIDFALLSSPFSRVGGMIATSCCWNLGMTIAIRRKFSTKRFWVDCKDTKATICQYIGELCGYLLDKYAAYNKIAIFLFVFLLCDLRVFSLPSHVQA
jgi:hypothetical protein